MNGTHLSFAFSVCITATSHTQIDKSSLWVLQNYLVSSRANWLFRYFCVTLQMYRNLKVDSYSYCGTLGVGSLLQELLSILEPFFGSRELKSTTMAEEKTYVPLHPEIFKYDEEFVKRFVDAKLHDLSSIEKVKAAVNEVAEQLYHFRLYTEDYCQLLIEECEHAQKVCVSAVLAF